MFCLKQRINNLTTTESTCYKQSGWSICHYHPHTIWVIHLPLSPPPLWPHINPFPGHQGVYSLCRKTSCTKPRKFSQLWDISLAWSNHSDIWQASRQHCCRDACQISEKSIPVNTQSWSFAILQNLTISLLSVYTPQTPPYICQGHHHTTSGPVKSITPTRRREGASVTAS